MSARWVLLDDFEPVLETDLEPVLETDLDPLLETDLEPLLETEARPLSDFLYVLENKHTQDKNQRVSLHYEKVMMMSSSLLPHFLNIYIKNLWRK